MVNMKTLLIKNQNICARAFASSSCLGLAMFALACPVFAQEAAPEKTTFDDHIKSLFSQRCAACHNPNKLSSDLDVTNFTNLMQGGGSGAAIEPGDSDSSYLFEMVADGDMPPDDKLPDAEIALIKKWIDGGALENKGSVAVKKKKIGMAMVVNPLERPAVVAMPPRLSLQPNFHTSQNGVVRCIATSPWAPLAAVASAQQVLIYNTQSLELVGVLPFPEGTVNVIRFSRNGQLLLAAGGKQGSHGKVVLWNIKSGERVAEIGDELDAVLAADISSDHTQVALGGSSKTIKVFSTSTGELLFEMTKPTEWVTSIEFSPDGVLLATGDRNGGLFVWEAMTGREYLTLNGHTASINGLSWRGDSNVLASASKDTTIRLWEMENGGLIKSWGSHGNGAMSIEFTRDARILSTGRDRLTKLWDQAGKQLKAFPELGEIGLSTSWCDETSRVISGDFAGAIPVWNGSDGVLVGQISHNPEKLETRLARANQIVATVTSEHAVVTKTFTDANAVATKLQTDLATVTKLMADHQASIQAAKALQTTLQLEILKLAGQQTVVQTRVTQLDAGIPLLKSSAKQVALAVEAIGTDPELVQVAQTMQALIATRSAEQLASKQSLTTVTVQLTAATQKMASATAEIKTLTTQVQAEQAQVNAITPTVPPAQEVAAKAKLAADAAAQKLASANAQATKWTEAIAFVATYDALKQKLGKATEDLVSRETENRDLVAQAELLQTDLDAKKTVQASAGALVKQRDLELKQQQADLLASQNAETATATKMAQQQAKIDGLNKLLPLLGEATEKFKGVAAIAATDKQIVEEAARVKALLDKNTNDLTLAVQGLALVKTELEAQKVKVNSVQQLVAKATADMGVATTEMQNAQKEVASVNEPLVQMQLKVVESTKIMEAAKLVVTGVEHEIVAVKGLSLDAL
jgi:WD40 repeat protein/mono/diheme cytochrome c family protein